MPHTPIPMQISFPTLRRLLWMLCLPFALNACAVGADGKGNGAHIFMSTQDQSVLFE